MLMFQVSYPICITCTDLTNIAVDEVVHSIIGPAIGLIDQTISALRIQHNVALKVSSSKLRITFDSGYTGSGGCRESLNEGKCQQ